MSYRQWMFLFFIFTLQISCGGGGSSSISDPVVDAPDEGGNEINNPVTDIDDSPEPSPADGDDLPGDQHSDGNPFTMNSETFSVQATILSSATTSSSDRYQATHTITITR